MRDKLIILKNSELKQVQDFCDKYKNKEAWTKELSEERARNICKDIYDFSIENLNVK